MPPLAAVDVLGAESRSPLPDFATKRGLGAALIEERPAGAAVDPAAPFSPNLAGAGGVAPFAARKVLLTETGLNEANFFTVDAVRP